MTKLLWWMPLLFNACSINAFIIPRTDSLLAHSFVSRLTRDEFSSAPPASSLGNCNDSIGSYEVDDQWLKQLQSTEIQQVRNEIVQKYVQLGKTLEEAQIDVDRFLADPEQSHPYLEMRRSAKSQELVGPELFLQLAGSFAIGWFAMAFATRMEVS